MQEHPRAALVSHQGRSLVHAGNTLIANAAGHIRTYDRPKEGAGGDDTPTTSASASNA
jgi:hypothetical protein